MSREIDIKLCEIYTKNIYIQFCIKILGLNRPYSANTQQIWKLRFAPIIILIDIIDSIITMCVTVSCDQNSHQWQCNILVPCLCQFLETYTSFKFSFNSPLKILPSLSGIRFQGYIVHLSSLNKTKDFNSKLLITDIPMKL